VRTFIYLILCLPLTLRAQDYTEYQRIFNRIDEDILSGHTSLSIPRLDSVYSNYPFIYARHCIKALQICGSVNDSINANKWLAKAFMQGVPVTVLLTNKLTEKTLHYSTTAKTLHAFDSLHALYLTSYNHTIAHTIDSLLAIDQQKTRKVNSGFILLRYTLYWPQWMHNNKKEYNIINAIINSNGFPAERLIGLPPVYADTTWTIKSFTRFGPNIFDRRVQTMLMHYYSNPRKDINAVLFRNVVSGYLTPKQYGILIDYMAEYGRGKYGTYTRSREWFKGKQDNTIAQTEAFRYKIGLNTLAQKHRNDSLFNQRVKDKTADQEIILE